MGGERPGYVVKYFDGTTYQSSVEKYLFNGFFHDNEKNYIKYDGECPTDKPFYAQVCDIAIHIPLMVLVLALSPKIVSCMQIRAKNSAGGSQFSERIEVNPGMFMSSYTVFCYNANF